MIRNVPYRSRNPDADDLKERYRGFVSLPKMLVPEDEALNLEAERWVAEDKRLAETDNGLRKSDRGMGGLVGTQVAQAAIPIPRLFPLLPPLFYDRGRGASPPRGPGPQSGRKSDDGCEEEYARNLARCEEYYPRAQFPGLDLDPRGRGLCKSEAFRVYSDCETGRKSKPFDPTLFYEE